MPKGIYKHENRKKAKCDVYRRIQEAIYGRNKTVLQVQEETGLGYMTIVNLTVDYPKLSSYNLMVICENLGANADYILFGRGPMYVEE